MTREETIKVLLDEWKCIDRNDGINCDRKCEKCDLVMDSAILKEAYNMAIKALEQEPCDDVVSRQAVEDKLLKLCNELEGIFANIRMQNQDESVCGLCEYDCPAPYECPGFDIEDCFKLADERRHKWQSTKELPSVRPQELTREEQALLQKWRDNRGISMEEFSEAMNALQEPQENKEGGANNG